MNIPIIIRKLIANTIYCKERVELYLLRSSLRKLQHYDTDVFIKRVIADCKLGLHGNGTNTILALVDTFLLEVEILSVTTDKKTIAIRGIDMPAARKRLALLVSILKTLVRHDDNTHSSH